MSKNTVIVSFIGLFGLGLFLTFFNLLSSQLPANTVASSVPEITFSRSSSSFSSSLASSSNSSSSLAVSSTSSIYSSSSNSSISSSSKSSSAVVVKSNFKDGNYNAQSDYGYGSVTVNLTLSGDSITNLSDSYSGLSGRSQSYKNSFESGVKSQVVGKKIDQINLSRVGGASYTTAGFMDAITQIKSQAQN
jgi:uncharacterized protein with FMN-binding domain